MTICPPTFNSDRRFTRTWLNLYNGTPDQTRRLSSLWLCPFSHKSADASQFLPVVSPPVSIRQQLRPNKGKQKKKKKSICNPPRQWLAWGLSVQTNTGRAVICLPSHSVRPILARSNIHTRLSGLDPSLPFVFPSTWQTSTLQFHFLGKQLSDRVAFRSEVAKSYDNLGTSANSSTTVLRKRVPLVFMMLWSTFE